MEASRAAEVKTSVTTPAANLVETCKFLKCNNINIFMKEGKANMFPSLM
jgi:hypothetical protein